LTHQIERGESVNFLIRTIVLNI